MATTINSGYANSPKLTANIADHADVYGGRALVFDGVADGLQCTSAYIHDKLDSSSHFTSSIWMKPADITATEGTIFSQHDRNAISIMQHGSGYLIYLNNNIIINGFNNGTFANGVWHHFVVTYDKTNVKVYLNGSLISTTSATYTLASHSNNIQYIGSRQNANYFNGSLADFKLFDTALTEAQVQELYLKPENTPSAVQDNLIWWLPMIEGNPESPQSIVYDHSEKKLGSEISGDPTFDNASNWSVSLGNGGVDVNTTVSGKLSVVNAQDTRLYKYSILTVGKLYKVTFVVDSYSSGRVRGLLDNAITFTPTGAGTYTRYFIASNTFFLVSFDGTANMTMTDISIKEVLMGNHATTNFFGDELITNGTFDSNTSSWLTNNGAVLSSESGGQSGNYLKVLTASISNPEAKQAFTVEPNKQYRYSFYHKDVNSSSDTPQYAVYNISASSFITNYANVSSSISSSSWVLQEHTFTTPSGCTSVQINLRHTGTADDNSYFGFDTVSVKEIGISSSGFETAVNEPVVPQVPLMRYNQKMITSSTASANTYVHLPDGLTAGLTEITISLWFQKIQSGNSRVVLFAVDGGGTYFRDIGNNRITCHMPFDNGGNPFSYFDFPSDLAPHHYVFTVKSGSQEVYRDGVLVHSTTVTTTTMSHNIRRIGNYANEQDTSMADEFAIFNKHFTQAEAQELFNDGVALDATTHSQSANLIGYWRNDGLTTWKDRSTNSNNGTVQGTPDSITIREGLNTNRDALGFYFTNPSNNVLRLNGVDEYVQIPDNKVFSFGDSNGDLPFSIEAWIKPENATNFTIISKGKYNVDGEYLLQLDADKKLYFALYDGNAYEGALYNTALGDYEGSWLHICATYNGVGGTSANAGIKLYVDSEQKSVSLLGGNTYQAMHNDSGEVEIGKYDNIYANGIIDELRIYNKELSLAEIQKNYKHQKGKHKND